MREKYFNLLRTYLAQRTRSFWCQPKTMVPGERAFASSLHGAMNCFREGCKRMALPLSMRPSR